jgi:tRNA A-37 threonylcarbamoyl transferase component Bud32
MPPMTGRVIAGRYTLAQPIGRGAMGMVWRAHDQLLDREVAVKEVVLSAAIGEDERRNAYQRTLREARTAARLSHRGVVTVYDVAEEDGRPWIVMELVPSRSLDQVLLAEGSMTPLRAGRVGQQLLAALAAAHAAGVLHRDVKPSNVLIATDRSGAGWDERAVLTDFGIAQFEGDPRLTQTGMVMGSPGFTAPERIRGGDATPASDLWSLGATIYAAVEGRGPYEQRGGAITTMSAIINEDAPIAPSAGRLAPLIAALLRREPSARPSARAATRMFSEVLPLLADVPAHPATVLSPYVPAPAAPVVSAAAEAAEAAGAGYAGAGYAKAPPAAVADSADVAAADAVAVAPADADAASADVAASDVAVAGQGAVALADVGAAVAGDAAAADEAVPAEAAVPVASAATSLDAVLGDLALSEGGTSRPDGGAAARAEDANPLAATVTPSVSPDDTPGQADEPAACPAEPDADPGAVPAGPAPTVAGPAPTELSVPAALPQPKPTFTAAKRAEKASPSFSPSQPAQPAPAPSAPAQQASAQQAPSFSSSRPTWRTDPPTTPAPAYESPEYGERDAHYASSNAQYAGPSQPAPDLARQYAPGTGGRDQSGSRRGRMIALIVAALIAAAAIGGGLAYALRNHSNSGAAQTTGNSSTANLPQSVQALDNQSSAVPTGWSPESVSPADTGTTAGFTIDIPPGWTVKSAGLRTYLYAPNEAQNMEIDLTPHTYTNMVKEAMLVEKESVARGAFPNYKRVKTIAVPVRGTNGAFWQFTWVPSSGVKMRADDIFFIARTSAGSQSYAIYFQSPDYLWNHTALPLFSKMLRTFKTVPA